MKLSRRRFLASMAGLAALSGSAHALPTAPAAYALTCRVLAGPDLAPRHNHAVLIRDGLIEAVVPASTVGDRPVIPFPEATVLPGVINAHCHGLHSPAERRDRWLAYGVTSVGVPGAPLAAMAELERSPAGTTATAAFSGPMLAAPGGYPLPVHDKKYGLVVRNPREATEAVKRLAGNGATMVKLAFEPGVLPHAWPMLDRRTAAAACDTARALGLVVRCHVQDLSGLEPALDAGVHVVDHVPHRLIRGMQRLPVLTGGGSVIPRYRKLLERMVRDNVLLVPTLDVLSRTPWNGPELFEPVRVFHGMGGSIAAGNDYPYRRTEAGMMTREFRLLQKAGLDAGQVLKAATHGSATACGLEKRGVIAPGMRADLLVVQSDPNEDMSVLDHPVRVIKDGMFAA